MRCLEPWLEKDTSNFSAITIYAALATHRLSQRFSSHGLCTHPGRTEGDSSEPLSHSWREPSSRLSGHSQTSGLGLTRAEHTAQLQALPLEAWPPRNGAGTSCHPTEQTQALPSQEPREQSPKLCYPGTTSKVVSPRTLRNTSLPPHPAQSAPEPFISWPQATLQPPSLPEGTAALDDGAMNLHSWPLSTLLPPPNRNPTWPLKPAVPVLPGHSSAVIAHSALESPSSHPCSQLCTQGPAPG